MKLSVYAADSCASNRKVIFKRGIIKNNIAMKERKTNYRVTLYFASNCSISSPKYFSSDEEAVIKGLEELSSDKDYFAVMISKYTGFDEKRGLWNSKLIYASDKRGEVTISAPLERERVQEAYDKLKPFRPVYIKLKNGKWCDTIFADTLLYFLKKMANGDSKIEYITNTIKLGE